MNGARTIAAAGVAAVLVLWWTGAEPPVGDGATLLDAGRLTGLLAGYVALLQLALRARVGVVERSLGTDTINAAHRTLGCYLVTLVVAHVALITAAYAAGGHRSLVSQLGSLLIDYPYVWWAAVGLGLLLVVVGTSMRPLRRRQRYEVWHGIHLLGYAALSLAFFHQVANGEHFRHNAWLRTGWTTAWIAVGALLVWTRWIHPLKLAARHRLAVSAVRHEAADIVTIEMAGRRLDAFPGAPGQYFRWRFLAPGRRHVAHPYSLSAEPDGHRLRITAQVVGDHSRRLCELAVGTPVIAEGPSGGLSARPGWRGPVLLIAGGIGITPLRALFATAPCAENAITLIYRVHDLADIVFRAELEQIAARRGGTVHFLTGRRDQPRNDLSPTSLTRLCPDLARSRVFVCGPAGYAQAIRSSLESLGVPRGRMRSESFQL
jgi:ferredoxin-NADP reductase